MSFLTEQEIIKLKTICEFLFYDNYQYWATYSRFEKCFQPLFNNININLYEVFTSIIGKQKKYMTYKRFLKAYFHYKNNEVKDSKDLYLFFDIIFNKILKGVNEYIGKHEEYSLEQNIFSFSTKKSKKPKNNESNESFISRLQVLKDKHEKIMGIALQYDDIDNYALYPKGIKRKLLLGLEINLDIINKDSFIRNQKLYENINLSLYRDSITHIFGTINENNIISFLGFKCVSGKTVYFGIPDGESFLFGQFGKKFHNLRLEMKKNEGITLLEPGFIANKRANYHLNKFNDEKMKSSLLRRKKMEKEEILMDEKYITTMSGDKLNQFITTPVMEDGGFSTQDTKETIAGYDYKEVVNQSNRDWIKNNYKNVGNYFAKIMFKDSKSLLEKLKNKSILQRESTIKEYDSGSEAFEYSPCQNPFFENPFSKEEETPYNPFFSQKITGKKPTFKEGIELHKNVELIPKKEEKEKPIPEKPKKSLPSLRYSGTIEEDTKPEIFLKTKYFKNLKEELSSNIYKQFHEQYLKKNNINTQIPYIILNEIVPYEEDDKRKSETKPIEYEKPKKERVLKIKGKSMEINDEVDCNNNLEINKDENNQENQETIYSDGYQLWKDIKLNLGQKKKKEKVNKRTEIKSIKNIAQKWQMLYKRLKLHVGVNLLQTIKSIINAMKAITKKDISLEEKIKYYNILNDKNNERIINFISQKDDEEEKNEEKNDEEEEDVLLPDKNPEKFNSLENLETTINNVKKEIPKESKNKKSETTYKKIIKFLIQEKNILIENITNTNKEQLMENYNYRGFIYEEKRKREAWELDDERRLSKSNLIDNNQQDLEQIEINEDISKLTFHNQDLNFIEGKDPKFIPIKESLCPLEDDKKKWKLPDKVLNSDIENWESIIWEKSEGIKRVFFSNESQPTLDNIRQGEYIGDCYFLSALGSLCNEDKGIAKMDYIKNLIKIVKRDGSKIIFAVKLNINGFWKYVLTDNYFPFIVNQNGRLNFCFGSSFKKELWVSLFEKAWAKVNGCYARIGSGGYCSEAFDVLTDSYTELIHIKVYNDKKDELWNKLLIEKQNNYVMCAGSKRFGLFDNTGLISNHAYTLMNLYELKEEGLKLVKLRNPWGEKEFIGDWSDKSSKWTPEIKKKVDFQEDKDDGIFYMSYDDFIKNYEILEILKMKDGYGTVASCKIKKTEAHKCQIIQFEISEKKQIFINLYQKNPRIIRKDGTYFQKPVKSFIILAKQESPDNYTYIKSVINTKVHFGIEAELDAGTYLIFCDVNYRFVYDEIYGYNITFYSKLSSSEIKVTNITNNYNGKERARILNKVIYNYYDKNKGEKKFTEIKTNNGVKFYKLNNFNDEFPFIILLFINTKKENVYLNCTLKYDSTDKNVCIYNDSEASEFDKQIIKKIDEDYSILLLMGYTISDRFSFSFNFSDSKKELIHIVFNDKYKIENENEKSFLFYVFFAENRRGCILGLEKTEGDKVNMNIKLKGLNDIDPFYDDIKKLQFLEDNKVNIKFVIGEKDKKVFNLRFKPDCEDFDYEFEH